MQSLKRHSNKSNTLKGYPDISESLKRVMQRTGNEILLLVVVHQRLQIVEKGGYSKNIYVWQVLDKSINVNAFAKVDR